MSIVCIPCACPDCIRLGIWKVLFSRIIEASAADPIEDLVRRDAPLAVGRPEELLGDDPHQALGEHAAHLRLLVGGEGVDDAVDRRGRAVRVDGGEDEDAEARELERQLHGLVGPELADEDHVRVLAPGAADRVRVGRRVRADLAVRDAAPSATGARTRPGPRW